MIKVAPSILSADFANLQRDISIIAPSGGDYVHVDVMDGIFVPNISIGIPVVAALKKVSDLPLDVHLMIDRPIRYAQQFCDAGAHILTIHYEADTRENTIECLKKIAAFGVKPGLSIKPGTPAEEIRDLIHLCALVLVMTVEPGFGGQKFMADMMPKVEKLRRWINETNPECELEVDGGVDTITAKVCINSGANVLVAGSAYYKAQNKQETVRAIKGA